MMFGWPMDPWAWLWMGGWILVLAAVTWFLVREPRRSDRDEALEILRNRLARGEITPDEFEHARQLLGSSPEVPR